MNEMFFTIVIAIIFAIPFGIMIGRSNSVSIKDLTGPDNLIKRIPRLSKDQKRSRS